MVFAAESPPGPPPTTTTRATEALLELTLGAFFGIELHPVRTPAPAIPATALNFNKSLLFIQPLQFDNAKKFNAKSYIKLY